MHAALSTMHICYPLIAHQTFFLFYTACMFLLYVVCFLIFMTVIFHFTSLRLTLHLILRGNEPQRPPNHKCVLNLAQSHRYYKLSGDKTFNSVPVSQRAGRRDANVRIYSGIATDYFVKYRKILLIQQDILLCITQYYLFVIFMLKDYILTSPTQDALY